MNDSPIFGVALIAAAVLVAYRLTTPPPAPTPLALIRFPSSPLILPENRSTDPAQKTARL